LIIGSVILVRPKAVTFTWAKLRVETSAACLAAALVLPLTDFGLAGPMMGLTWLLIGAGFILARKSIGPVQVWLALLFIVGSAIVAIPGTFIWGYELWVPTVILAMLTIPMVAFYLTDDGERVLTWIAPVYLLHTGLIYAHAVLGLGPRGDDARIMGLSGNPNPAAAFLVLGAAFFLGGRYKWMALPLIVAVPLTGARWAALVMGGMLLGWALRTYPLRRVVIVGAAGTVLLLAVMQSPVGDMYRIGDVASLPVELVKDIKHRLPIVHNPTIWPRGFADDPRVKDADGKTYQTPHNVPLRMATETGILSGVAWIGLTGWALWRRPRLDTVWWMLAAVAALSMMYYFPWIERMGGFWWLLIGIRAKQVLPQVFDRDFAGGLPQ
jgi:hypothetical protein